MNNSPLESSGNLELKEKIKLIEQIDAGSEQKAQLVLVILGIKPATQLTLYKWNSSPQTVQQILQKVKLEYKKQNIKDDNKEITAKYAISLKKELVEKLLNCSSSREYGELMGYPETAIDGFEKNNRYEGELPEDIKNSIFKLRFSKDHYKKEFEVIRKWNKALSENAPDLLKICLLSSIM